MYCVLYRVVMEHKHTKLVLSSRAIVRQKSINKSIFHNNNHNNNNNFQIAIRDGLDARFGKSTPYISATGVGGTTFSHDTTKARTHKPHTEAKKKYIPTKETKFAMYW